jgi:hypothetical protein
MNNSEFRLAVAQLQSEVFFGNAILIIEVGDDITDQQVLDGETLTVLTPSQQELDDALIRANTSIATETLETTQADSARNSLKSLMIGLQDLSSSDKGYAVYVRLMAWRDGADNPTILGIVDKASAVAYVTSKAEWANTPATVKPMLNDMMETNAALCQVLLLIL